MCATYNWRHVVYHDTSKCTFINFNIFAFYTMPCVPSIMQGKGVAATISVDRLLDLPFLRHGVVAEGSNPRGGNYGYEYGGNLRLTTTLMDWPVCHENIQLWHVNCYHTCRKYEDISSNNVRIWVLGRHFEMPSVVPNPPPEQGGVSFSINAPAPCALLGG